jgi:hypothetical protein
MLKEVLQAVDPKKLLLNAFRKCGIYPVNREEVLAMILSAADTQKITKDIDAILLKKLEVRRFGEGKKRQPRGKKIPAGQSYSAECDSEEQVVSNAEAGTASEVEDLDSNEEEGDKNEDNRSEDASCEELPDLNPPQARRQAGMAIKGRNVFGWGKKADLVDTFEEDIILHKVEPVPANNRDHLQLCTNNHLSVLSRMV